MQNVFIFFTFIMLLAVSRHIWQFDKDSILKIFSIYTFNRRILLIIDDGYCSIRIFHFFIIILFCLGWQILRQPGYIMIWKLNEIFCNRKVKFSVLSFVRQQGASVAVGACKYSKLHFKTKWCWRHIETLEAETVDFNERRRIKSTQEETKIK